MHDIEINTWGKKVFAETREVQEIIMEIISSAKDNDEVVEKSCSYFDALYEGINP